MNAFIYGIVLQWKIDVRNKNVLLTYYVIPLVFFAFMGGIFTSINPYASETIMQSMTVFGVTMGSILGVPTPLVEVYGSEIKKAYKVGNIPLWSATINNIISSFIHLFIMSLVIFFVSPLVFDAKIPLNLVHYFLSLSVFILTSILIGTILGLYIKNLSKITMVSQFIFLPSIMLSGIMFPISMLPKILEDVSRVFPATWGFMLMTSDSFDIKFLIPLFIIMIVSVCVNSYKLLNIKLD